MLGGESPSVASTGFPKRTFQEGQTSSTCRAHLINIQQRTPQRLPPDLVAQGHCRCDLQLPFIDVLAEDRGSVCILREREFDFSKDLREVRALAISLSRQRLLPDVRKQPVQRP